MTSIVARTPLGDWSDRLNLPAGQMIELHADKREREYRYSGHHFCDCVDNVTQVPGVGNMQV
jgi:hypothetical protein